MGGSLIRPVGNLVSIDPNADMRPRSNDRFGKPGQVIGDYLTCGCPAKNPTRTAIDRLVSALVRVLVLDLAFVTVHQFPWNAAKEQP